MFNLKKSFIFIFLFIFLIMPVNAENNIVDETYNPKNNLIYCINYFYGGIIDVNKTECFYNQEYGKVIDSFTDKPREGYVLKGFDPITVLDIEENIMNVYYEKEEKEIIPPDTGIELNNMIISISFLGLIIGIYSIKKYINT